MSLLREIQNSLMDQNPDIGSILMKLRYLASRMESDPLANWVRFESEGYPNNAEIPDYRIIGVSYTVSTRSGIQDASVPTRLVMKTLGDHCGNHKCHQSVAAINRIVSKAKDGCKFRIDASDLIPALQEEIYPDDLICNVTGLLSITDLDEIQNVIKSRILDLTFDLERETSFVTDIVRDSVKIPVGTEEQQKISQITNNFVHGNYSAVSNSGVISDSMLSIVYQDENSVVSVLMENGVIKEDAQEFANILAEEEPESVDKPFGAKAKAWVGDKVGRIASGAKNVGIDIATKLLTDVAQKYYFDLK